MRGLRPARIGLALLALLVPARALDAHDFWIEPDAFAPREGASLALGLRVGDHFQGDAFPRSYRHAERFELLGPTRALPVLGEDQQLPAGRVPSPEPGLCWAVYRSRDALASVPPETFAAYLADEGHARLLAAWKATSPDPVQPVKEAFSRCAKALLNVGGEPEARAAKAPGFDRKAGLKLELVPELNPLSLAPGDELAVRLLWDGRPLADQQVAALSAAAPLEPVKARTDAEGRVSLKLARAGVWLVKSVHIERAQPGEALGYRSTWASLTFELPPPAPAGGE